MNSANLQPCPFKTLPAPNKGLLCIFPTVVQRFYPQDTIKVETFLYNSTFIPPNQLDTSEDVWFNLVFPVAFRSSGAFSFSLMFDSSKYKKKNKENAYTQINLKSTVQCFILGSMASYSYIAPTLWSLVHPY